MQGVVEDSLPLILGIQVERSFNWFFISASLAEFWSFRWNHHVAGLLKNVVYEPIVSTILLFFPIVPPSHQLLYND